MLLVNSNKLRFLSVYNGVFCVSNRFLPFVGMVTIWLNEYTWYVCTSLMGTPLLVALQKFSHEFPVLRFLQDKIFAYRRYGIPCNDGERIMHFFNLIHMSLHTVVF